MEGRDGRRGEAGFDRFETDRMNNQSRGTSLSNEEGKSEFMGWIVATEG